MIQTTQYPLLFPCAMVSLQNQFIDNHDVLINDVLTNNRILTNIDRCLILNATCGSVYKYLIFILFVIYFEKYFFLKYCIYLPEEVQAYFDCEGEGPHGPLYSTSTCSRVTTTLNTTGCPNNTIPPHTAFYLVFAPSLIRLLPLIYMVCLLSFSVWFLHSLYFRVLCSFSFRRCMYIEVVEGGERN